MIDFRSCAWAILPGAGIRSTTSGSAFFAGESLRAGRWTFAVYLEENSGFAVPRWGACPRRNNGVMRSRQLVLIPLKGIGDTICLTNSNGERMNHRCERRPVAYDWRHFGRACGHISAR
jgi:hypothetical protein